MCMSEKLFKFIFPYENVILDYHNVIFNSKPALKKLNWLLKKTRNFFLSSDLRFEISAKNPFRKHLLPDALFSKKKSLWDGGTVNM